MRTATQQPSVLALRLSNPQRMLSHTSLAERGHESGLVFAIALRLGSPQHREAVNEKRADDRQIDRLRVGIVHMSIIRDAEARAEDEADF
jgi:hypothetical protein